MSKKYFIIIGAIVVLAGVVWWLYSKNDSKTMNDPTTNNNTQQQQTENAVEPKNQVTDQSNQPTSDKCVRTYSAGDEKKVSIAAEDKFVTLEVAKFGKIKIELNRKEAPKTSENFLRLAKSGFYNCLTIHRVAAGFVIQGGDPKGDGSGGPGYNVPAEIGLKHTKGAIAMARLPDQVNPKQESSGSQFYIALEALPMLDGAYTVFGQVVSGMDVVTKIGGVPINAGPFGGSDGPPKETITINSAITSAQ